MMRRDGPLPRICFPWRQSAAVLALAGAVHRPAEAVDLPKSVNAEEWRAFQDTLERFNDRMGEFQIDAETIVQQHEDAEVARIGRIYDGMLDKLRTDELAQRQSAVARLEAFLRKYPVSPYSADMKFRLADLYFQQAEDEFFVAQQEYQRFLQAIAGGAEVQAVDEPLKEYGRSMALYLDIVANNQDYENLPDTYYMLAWCYNAANSAQNNEEKAREINEQIVARWPGTPFANDANLLLGQYWFEKPARPKVGNPGSPGYVPAEPPLIHMPMAISYYLKVMADGPTGRNYDKSIYQLGWATYKQDEWDQALSYMVQLLDYSDKKMAESGKPSNMRPEAVKYLAISYADMASEMGRRPVDVAVEHLKEVAKNGGERGWAHEELEVLADRLEQRAEFPQAIDVYAYLQTRWPMHPDNPVYQSRVAEAWLKMPPQGDQQKSDEAMKQLGENYSESSAWYAANRTNPDAIARARAFIETSLAQVATELFEGAQESGSVQDYALAAAKFKEFLDKYPFGENYNDYEYYYASTLFLSNQFDEALLAYDQVLKNERSPYREVSRYQVLQTRNEIVLAKYGKLEDVPQGQTVQETVTGPFGKPVTVYLISDEQKAFIVACDDIVDREFTDPDTIQKIEKSRTSLMYIPALIYMNHGYIAEARVRLERLIKRYPATREAGLAASLLLNSYSNEGDLERVAVLAKELEGIGTGEETKEFKNIREQAEFNLAAAIAAKGEHIAASERYLQFIAQFPESQYLKQALFNAARQADLAGNAVEAIKLYERYVKEYPNDERSKPLYFVIAETYQATLQLEKAVKNYDDLVRLFPDFEDAPAAMFNSAFLRVGLEDHKGAAALYEKYAITYKDQADAEPTFWRAGEQWEAVSEADAQKFYNRYLDRYGASNPNHAIEALYKLAKIQERKGDRGAVATWAKLQSTFAAASVESLTQHTRGLAAEGAVRDLEKQYELFKVVKWDKDDLKNVKILTEAKIVEVKAILDRSLAIVSTYQDYDSSAAAVYFIGMSYFAYSDIIYEIPAPKGASEELETEFRRQIDEYTGRIALEAKARTYLQQSLDKAKADKRWSVWNSKALNALNERYPSEFPSERTESRGTIDPGDVPLAGPTSEVTKKEETP